MAFHQPVKCREIGPRPAFSKEFRRRFCPPLGDQFADKIPIFRDAASDKALRLANSPHELFPFHAVAG